MAGVVMARKRYISGHPDRQPDFIEREMAEIRAIEKEFADFARGKRRSR